MPTTVRISVSLSDPLSGLDENLDAVTLSDVGRHERWSIFGGAEQVQLYWPLNGELTVFLQVWQPQPALNETTFKLAYPGSEGWSSVIPKDGKIPLMFSKPATSDILYVLSDPYSVEVDVMYF